jgi:DNA-binding CsgD family transcriptional regulator
VGVDSNARLATTPAGGVTRHEGAATRLLERAEQLAALQDGVRRVARERRGALVLLAGETGGGKTALLREFRDACGSRARVLWGACDPLFTPRPLGPFADIAADGNTPGLSDALEAGGMPHQVATAILRDAQARPGTILIVEDAHWADEATLDVLSLLGRRIESFPALIVVSYRGEELDRTHPLRTLLGDLRGPSVHRLSAEPLSRDAVATLAKPYRLDPDKLYHATAGNPFYITEVLAARGDEIPETVRDAVLARTARLSAAATAVIEAVSIAVPQAEVWLLDALVPDDVTALDECLRPGILVESGSGVAFRHELARLTIEEALPPHRRLALHRRALRALATPPSGPTDLARLAHHADAAGDAGAVGKYAPAAAEHAASIGAHREAAAQYERALRYGDDLTADARATMLERLSYEDYLTGRMDAGIAGLRRAIVLRQQLGDPLALGSTLSTLSRRLYCGGLVDEAAVVGEDAVRLLEPLPPSRELALAYSNLGQIHMNEERVDETVTWATRALEIAESLCDTDVIVHSLNNLGTMQILAGLPDGIANLTRSAELADRPGLEEHLGRAYINAAWAAARARAYDLEPWLDRGVTVCQDLGLEVWRQYVIVHRARFHLDRGRWTEAADGSAYVLDVPDPQQHLLIFGLSVLGVVRARRGDPDSAPLLDHARSLLDGQHELQYVGPVAAARAEAAWLRGRTEDVAAATSGALDLAVERRAGWLVGELAWLRRLAGVRETVDGATGPYALQLAGDATAAAQRWRELGCPYDAALALVDSDDEANLRDALTEFQRLGARPAAAIAARRLRESGVRGLPRGPRAATNDHPARLTRRESEVLALLQEGLSNADIAARLYLAEKTVHHHVSAVLRKLGVESRAQAASEVTRRGLTPATSG